MIIDAHQHFWVYQKESHGWIDDSMQKIQRDFLPEHLLPLLENAGIDACIAVQADQTNEETEFLVNLATKNSWIKAVIGWVDLKSDKIEEELISWKKYPVLKGFRHILQAEEANFMLSAEFKKGIAALQKMNYCYEILIYPHQLQAALLLVKEFPEMRFVVDHIAKPNIKNHEFVDWQSGIELLAACKNVYCKISGLVTEADWGNWKCSDFEKYISIVTNAFGVDRLMYGSDWPVCLVAADYQQQLDICKQFFKDYSATDKAKLFGENAIRFYQI